MNKLFTILLLLLWGSATIGQTLDSSHEVDSSGSKKIYELRDSGIQMPVFPGGEIAMYEYIGKTLTYPPTAFENEIQGKVIVQFVIQTDGSVTEIRTIGTTRLGWGCEEEAVRVIKSMPRWQPATIDGKPVPVRFLLPIKYEIQEVTPKKKKSRKSKDTPREEPKKSNPTSLPTNKPQNPNPYD